jgi:hypothetical protein
VTESFLILHASPFSLNYICGLNLSRVIVKMPKFEVVFKA